MRKNGTNVQEPGFCGQFSLVLHFFRLMGKLGKTF